MSDDKTGQNRTFEWDKPREFAAKLLAEDEQTDVAIAEAVGVSDRQLRRWKQHPEFMTRVAEIAKELTDSEHRRAIAKRASRLRVLDQQWEALQQVIAERAADINMAAVPGGRTGLLIRRFKSVGSGESCQVVQEFEVDTGLLRELREYSKMAAQETGQWSDKHEVSGPGGGPMQTEVINDDERTATVLAILASVGTPGTRPGVAAQTDPGGHPVDPARATLPESGDGAGPVADGPTPLIF